MNGMLRPAGLFGIFLAAVLFGTISASAQPEELFDISESVLSFEQPCGTEECSQVAFTNNGNKPVTVAVASGPSLPFAFDPAIPFTTPFRLEPSETVTGSFCYQPTSADGMTVQNIVFSVKTSDGSEQWFDTLTLSGISRSARAEFDPPTLNFASLTVGNNSCFQVTLKNTGTEPLDPTILSNVLFPFTISGLPGAPVAPGNEVDIELCFEPISPGAFADTLRMQNGPCREPALLTVSGTGLPSIPNLGPVLEVVSVDFDTTMCGTSKCRSVTLRNVGTDTLEVSASDDVAAPFNGFIAPLPTFIPPNEERNFSMCYTPETVPSSDMQTINFTADNRVAFSIAALFDVSISMSAPFGPVKRIDAANAAGQFFLGNLVDAPELNIVDEAAVYRFGASEDYERLAGYSSDFATLQDAVPTTALSNGTCMYDAVFKVSGELGVRSTPDRRVMVILADGENSCTDSNVSLDDAIAAAQGAGIRIYTIGISIKAADRPSFRRLAEETGGFFSEAISPSGLLESYRQIIRDLSKNQPASFTLKGSSVAPGLEITPQTISFDSVRVGFERCETITLHNPGTAPLELSNFVRPGEHFKVLPATVPTILPGDSVQLQVCFRPGRLREIDSIFRFSYTECVPQEKTVTVNGIGYDSVVVSVSGLYYAEPGTVITVPIQLTGIIPEDYDVDSLALTFRYNKTLLHPEPPEGPLTIVSGITSTSIVEQNTTAEYGDTDALLNVNIRLDGSSLSSTVPDTLLAELNMLALHGNAIETDLELVSASFADGNPKVTVSGGVTYTADSLCYMNELLIDASGRYEPTMKLVSLTSDQATVLIELPQTTDVDAMLFGPHGATVGRIFRGRLDGGQHEAHIELDNLATGAYLLRLITDGRNQQVMKILVQH